jgi:GNAT superfamily N-acetyltransferase
VAIMGYAFESRPLTPDAWADLEALFDLPGGSIVRGCWLQRSPIMKPVDDRDVWSVVCTYVAKRYRGQGVQRRLLKAAIRYAREQGVRILEAYPVDKPERSHDDFMFFGSRSLYERAGFTEVVRRSPTRVVMRRNLRPVRTPR